MMEEDEKKQQEERKDEMRNRVREKSTGNSESQSVM
jgi:hypothetical protein